MLIHYDPDKQLVVNKSLLQTGLLIAVFAGGLLGVWTEKLHAVQHQDCVRTVDKSVPH